MGERVRAAVDAEPETELAAALEAPGHSSVGETLAPGVDVCDDAKVALNGCDVAIDFTVPAATLAVMQNAADAGVAYVCGWSSPQKTSKSPVVTRTPVIPPIMRRRVPRRLPLRR